MLARLGRLTAAKKPTVAVLRHIGVMCRGGGLLASSLFAG